MVVSQLSSSWPENLLSELRLRWLNAGPSGPSLRRLIPYSALGKILPLSPGLGGSKVKNCRSLGFRTAAEAAGSSGWVACLSAEPQHGHRRRSGMGTSDEVSRPIPNSSWVLRDRFGAGEQANREVECVDQPVQQEMVLDTFIQRDIDLGVIRGSLRLHGEFVVILKGDLTPVVVIGITHIPDVPCGGEADGESLVMFHARVAAGLNQGAWSWRSRRRGSHLLIASRC